jgi:DNA-binding transcriptional ArsR family regulator
MSLLPSRPDASAPDDAEPRVINVDSDDADDVLAALSSETARELLSQLYEDPAPPSDLADRVDTSVQNVQYHLEKLENAGAVEVVDTAYSAKGREMDVYAPSDQPLVIFAGNESEGSTLRTALSRLLGALGILAVASLAVQTLYGENATPPWQDESGDPQPGEQVGGGDGDAAVATETQQETSSSGNGADVGNGADADGADAGATPKESDITSQTTTEDQFEAADLGNTTDTPLTNETVTPEETPTPNGTVTPEETPTPELSPTPDGTLTPEMTPTPEEVQTAAEAASGLPPGVLFFAGGAFALALVGVALSLR